MVTNKVVKSVVKLEVLKVEKKVESMVVKKVVKMAVLKVEMKVVMMDKC